jgi:NADH:ubiquinone oxidoreductase subunit E/NAD-dependent dihydropyrimidine dehydrogenase PreA subunit
MITASEERRIGVYVCHCGTNIAHTVDVQAVADYAGTIPGVVVSRAYKYMCSDPGQEIVKRDIVEQNLNRVVVASCSPLMHETTFRNACEDAGLNRFLFQMANIREHCSWVHSDRRDATRKAKRLVRGAVKRVWFHEALEEREVPVRPETLVVGAGIAGIEAALRIANSGKQVYLVEREPSIGGHMAKFDKTFPTLDCAACILTPKMVEVGEHRNIKLMSYSEVEDVSGYVGNFKVKVKRKARHIDEDKCTGCGLCVESCLVRNIPYLDPAEKVEVHLEPEETSALDGILDKYQDGSSALVPILQDVQTTFNYLPENALQYLAQRLSVPLAQIYRLASFYDAFSLAPQGKHVVRVCMGTACYVKGANRILEAFQKELGIGPDEITPDGQFSLQTVNCLGCCGQSPVVTVDEEIYGYFKQTKVPKLIETYV